MKTIRVYSNSDYSKSEFGDVLYGYPNPDVYKDSMTDFDHKSYLFLAFDRADCWLEVIEIDKSTGISTLGGFRCGINELNSFLSEV